MAMDEVISLQVTQALQAMHRPGTPPGLSSLGVQVQDVGASSTAVVHAWQASLLLPGGIPDPWWRLQSLRRFRRACQQLTPTTAPVHVAG